MVEEHRFLALDRELIQLVSPLIYRVSFETSFDSKQPKLVSTLSETKCLFRLFRFYIETASFGVSITTKHANQKQVEVTDQNSPFLLIICSWNCLIYVILFLCCPWMKPNFFLLFDGTLPYPPPPLQSWYQWPRETVL